MTRKRVLTQNKLSNPRKRSAEHTGQRRAVTPPDPLTGQSCTADSDPPHHAATASQILPVMADPKPVSGPSHAVIIEIDPSLSAGYVHGRFDIMVRGRAISAEPIEQIRLQADDWVTSCATFGQPERAASAIMPDGTPGRQRSFQFNLPRPGDGRAEKFEFQIIAKTDQGREVAEVFEIEVDPAASDQVVVNAGPTRPMASNLRPYAIMYIERATLDLNGTLNVQGWAVSLGPTHAVQIFASDEPIGKARTGGERLDVAAAFPAYPNARASGFSLAIQLDEVDRDAGRITAQLVGPNGFTHEESIPVESLASPDSGHPDHAATRSASASGQSQSAAFSAFAQQTSYQLSADFRVTNDPLFGLILPAASAAPVLISSAGRSPAEIGTGSGSVTTPADAPSTEIRAHCDAVTLSGDGLLRVEGWAVCGVGIVQIRVLLDNNDVGLATIGHERPDVASFFPKITMARLSGFRFEKQVGDRFEGFHEVRIIVRNMRDEEADQKIPVVASEVPVSDPEPEPVIAPPGEGPELTADQVSEFRFELDSPLVASGAAVALVTGRLTIDGWLLTRTGIASFEILLDGQRLGDAHYGLVRQDVGTAFPEWPNALRSGFAFHCPPRSLRDGDHTVELRIKANSDVALSRTFSITVRKSEDQTESLGIRRRVPRVEADMMTALLADMACRPSFQLILRQDVPVEMARLGVTLTALRRQAYPDWTVRVIAADTGIAAAVQAVTGQSFPDLADRISVITPADADAWLAPLGAAIGHETQVLCGLLLPGDEPAADALLEIAVARGRNPGCDLFYADEVRPSPVSGEGEPFFKPDFSPDLLLSTNYIGRLWFATAALLAKSGATAASLTADGEYDLLLRSVEDAAGVHHIPRLLCRRSAMHLDDSALEQAALRNALDRRGIAGSVLPTPVQGTWRVRRDAAASGKVSIIIPTCASKGYIETCIKTLRAATSYRDFEIICIDNIPASEVAWKIWLQQNADKVVEIPQAFNWSTFNNRAAEVAAGEFLLFLNDDIEIIQDDWLDAMLEHARRPEVAVTGARLLYGDGKVQHAGMFLATNGIGRHAFRFAASDDPCYFGLAMTQRNVIAVTGACMMVRRDTFERLGRFDEAHEIVNNDLDFCLRAHRAGLLTVFTPYATLTHHELASRSNLKDVFDLTHFNAAWKTTFAAGDPYFNPRLSRHADDYRPDDEPVQLVVAGAPMFRREEIQRILVVKLDHIGDFVTALPPIRRLKALFPHAEITVLAGPASRAFIALEPCIDAFIPFAFFHARSQLGERDLSKDDYAELADQLRPHRFDLAVDLRKHLSTRDVLKHTGARFLAGFDYLGQFPYLDIALDWDGDRTLQRKRSHIIDDLMGLVNAIGNAAESDRRVIQPGPVAMKLSELPVAVQALFGKPVVAIHPGAGNVTKQWPEEHFSALIDLLVEKNGVNVLLVGGVDEIDVANALLAGVQHPEAIASMVGDTSLADLPRLLKNCVLYIVNDSGPKHIAAAIGVPTVGIHSGVVDPVEWGPLGPNAVALRRNMTCSPCYLANAEDCPRSLACLRLFEPNLVYEAADLLLRGGGTRLDEDAARPPVEPETPIAEAVPEQPAVHIENETTAASFEPAASPNRDTGRMSEPKSVRRQKAAQRQRARETA